MLFDAALSAAPGCRFAPTPVDTVLIQISIWIAREIDRDPREASPESSLDSEVHNPNMRPVYLRAGERTSETQEDISGDRVCAA